jgi:transposase
LRLRPKQWGKILNWFLLGLPSARIAIQTRVERRRILRALQWVRRAMARDIPPSFSGCVEVDETYLGGQWKNKRQTVRARGTKRGRGTSKTPVFGILCREGQVWAQIVPDVEARTLMPLIRRRVTRGSTIFSDTWKSYTGIAAKGYVHRLVEHGKGEYVAADGAHINGLEGFWGYLKRRLAAKGGIRRERLPLYLAEYVWRYNHRHRSLLQQRKRLFNLLTLQP